MTAAWVLLFVGLVAAAPSVVNIPGLGGLKGVTQNGFTGFYGIPYAESPVGTLRWEPPSPKKPWAPNILDATNFGSCCLQNGGTSGSEDCLFLNVYTPSTSQTTPLPVMVFIHGGAYIAGCSNSCFFLADYMANSTNTVIVTINYRLGALGFLAGGPVSPELKGNYGIMDQILALQWVQQYISYFGGDPKQVTIFGQSAGAMSVTVLLVSPYSFKYNNFQRAIVQSNPSSLKYRTPDEMADYTQNFAVYLDCAVTDLECLRSKNPSEIGIAQDKTIEVPLRPSLGLTALPWEPVIDGDVLPDQPLKLYAQGKFMQVPLVIGTTLNDSAPFGLGALDAVGLTGITELEYDAFLLYFFQEYASTVNGFYPAGDVVFEALIAASTDYIFTCPSRNIALSAAALSKEPVYMYQFMHIPEDCVSCGGFPQCQTNQFDDENPHLDDPTGGGLGGPYVCHAVELPFVFHAMKECQQTITSAEEQLSLNLVKYWTSFAHGQMDESWPKFNSTHLLSMGLVAPTPYVVQGFNKERCDFWDKIGYNW